MCAFQSRYTYSTGVLTGTWATVAVDPTTGKPMEDVYLAFLPIYSNVAEFTVEVQSGADAATYSRYVFYRSQLEKGRLYNLRHLGDDISEQCIVFQDPVTEAICLQSFDKDGNGCISYREARSITYLGTTFQGSDIQYFNELKEFTGLTMIPANAFASCVSLKEVELPSSVTTIGLNAFNRCSSLLSIILIILNVNDRKKGESMRLSPFFCTCLFVFFIFLTLFSSHIFTFSYLIIRSVVGYPLSSYFQYILKLLIIYIQKTKQL